MQRSTGGTGIDIPREEAMDFKDSSNRNEITRLECPPGGRFQ